MLYFKAGKTPSSQGLMLHYRSKRRGFTTYTAGQLKAVATTYFKTEMGIEVKESEIKFDTVHVSFQVGAGNILLLKWNTELTYS